MAEKTPIPFKKALRIVLLSTLIVSGLPWLGFGFFTYLWVARANDPTYEIIALIQSTNSHEPLKLNYLAEALNLSRDQPKNLYKLDLNDAKKKLTQVPLIKEASLRRVPPGILFIEYVMRKPAVFLEDVSNTVLDLEHYSFPFHPFFSPKKLPILHIGIDKPSVRWGKKISDKRLDLAFDVLAELERLALHPAKIDVSASDAESLGERKIVVVMQSEKFSHYILLDPEAYKEGLSRYAKLMGWNDPKWKEVSGMLDLRLLNLGFFKEEAL